MSEEKKIIEAENIFDILMLAKGAGIFKNVRIGKTLGNKTYLSADILDVTDNIGLNLFLNSAMDFGPAIGYRLSKKKANLEIEFALTENLNDLYNGMLKNGFNAKYRPKFKLQFGVSLGF